MNEGHGISQRQRNHILQCTKYKERIRTRCLLIKLQLHSQNSLIMIRISLPAVSTDYWNIQFKSQPPKGPRFELVLDSRIFFFFFCNSIQHDHCNTKLRQTRIDESIERAQDAFNKSESNTLDNVFMTLQTCTESIVSTGEGEKFL